MATEAEILAETLKELLAEKVAETEERFKKILARIPPEELDAILSGSTEVDDVTSDDFRKLVADIQRYALEIEAEEIQELMSKLI